MQLCTASTPPYDEIVTLANRAPSVHNTQPWLWRVTDSDLELLADWSRHLPHADPDGRDLLVSCGAALHHLRVASQALGWRAEVSHRTARGRDPLLATVSFVRAPVPPGALRRLRALIERQTDRRAFATWPVPTRRLEETAERARRWGVEVALVGEEDTRSRLLALARRADQQQRRDDGYVAELGMWTREALPEGIPAANRPTAEPRDTSSEVPQRFPAGTLTELRSVAPPGELVTISTSTDDTASRVRAGEALSDLWLALSSNGLALVPLSQLVEAAEIRRVVQRLVTAGSGTPQVPQTVVRVGWPGPVHQASLPRTPRRPAADVLVRDEGPWRVTSAGARLGQRRNRGQETSS